MNINKKQLALELLRSPLIKQLNESGLWSKSEINRIIAQEILKEAGRDDDSDLFSPLAVDTLTPFLNKIRAMENTEELQKMLETNIGALAEVEAELKQVKNEIKSARAEGASRAELADLGDDSIALREEISEIKKTIEAINQTLEALNAVGEKVAGTPSKADDEFVVDAINIASDDIKQAKNAIDPTNIKTVEPALDSLESGLKDVGEYIKDELPNVTNTEAEPTTADPKEVEQVEAVIDGEAPVEAAEDVSAEAVKAAVKGNEEEIKGDPKKIDNVEAIIDLISSSSSESEEEDRKGLLGRGLGFVKDNWGWFELGIDIGKGFMPRWVGDAYNEVQRQINNLSKQAEVVAQILREDYEDLSSQIAKLSLERLEENYQSLAEGGKARVAAEWVIKKAVDMGVSTLREQLIEVAKETENIDVGLLTSKDKNKTKEQIAETEKFLLKKGGDLANALKNKLATTTGVAFDEESRKMIELAGAQEIFEECFGEEYKAKIAQNETFVLAVAEFLRQFENKDVEPEDKVVSEVLRLLKESGLFEEESEELTVEQELEKFKAFLDKKYEGSNVPVKELWNAAQQAEEKEEPETETTSLADAGGWKDSKDAARKKITPETTIEDIKNALENLESFRGFFGVKGPADAKYQQAIALFDEGYFQKRIVDLKQQQVSEESKEAFIEDTTELAATYQEYLDAVAGITDPDLERLVNKFNQEQEKQKAQEQVGAITVIPNTAEEYQQQFLEPALKIIDITPDEIESKPEQGEGKPRVISSDLEAQVKALAKIEDPKEFFDDLITIYKQLYSERGERIPGGLVAAVRKIKEKQASGKKYPEKNVDKLINLMGLEDDFGFESEIIVDKLKDFLVAGRKGGMDKTDISYDKSEIEKIVQGFFDRPTSEMQDTKTAFDNLLSVDDEIRENYVYPAIARVLSRTIQKRVNEIFGMKTRKSKNQTRTLLKTIRNFMEQDGKLDEFFLNQIALEKSFESRKFRKAFGQLKDFVQDEYDLKFSGEESEKSNQQSDEERMQDMLKMQRATTDDIMSQERPLGSSPDNGEEGGEELDTETPTEEPEEDEDFRGQRAKWAVQDFFKALPDYAGKDENPESPEAVIRHVVESKSKLSDKEKNQKLYAYVQDAVAKYISDRLVGQLNEIFGLSKAEKEISRIVKELMQLVKDNTNVPEDFFNEAKKSLEIIFKNEEFQKALKDLEEKVEKSLKEEDEAPEEETSGISGTVSDMYDEEFDLQEQRLIKALIPLIESTLDKSLRYK